MKIKVSDNTDSIIRYLNVHIFFKENGPQVEEGEHSFFSSDWFRRFIELSPSFDKSLRQQSVENSEFRSDTLEDNRHCIGIGIGIGKKLMTNLRLNSNHPNNDVRLMRH